MRVARPHGFIANTQAIDDSGPECFHEHIRRVTKPEQRIAIALLLEIQHDALLAAIEVAKEHRARAVRKSDVPSGIALAEEPLL